MSGFEITNTDKTSGVEKLTFISIFSSQGVRTMIQLLQMKMNNNPVYTNPTWPHQRDIYLPGDSH